MWGVEAFGKPFHDNWWQTETGGIMIANYASMDVKPGSMGRPLPGITAGIVEHLEGGAVREITKPMAMGELALRPGWPSMMRAYLNEEERYRKCFVGGWYLTGDLAMRDAEGYYWFVGRADDVIKSAGHLIGPFEVESALMEHPAVAEAGVIGIPDPTAGEVVKAFVALKGGGGPEELRREGVRRGAAAGSGGRSAEGHRLPPEPAEDAQRQDHAPPAQGARTRPAGGRHLDARKRGAMTAQTDKPHLSREHMLDLLKQMIRSRRTIHLGPQQYQGPDGADRSLQRFDRSAYARAVSASWCRKQQNGAIVRLRDVANVTLRSDDYESRVGFDGKQAVYVGIQVAPAANLLDVMKKIRDIPCPMFRRNCRKACMAALFMTPPISCRARSMKFRAR